MSTMSLSEAAHSLLRERITSDRYDVTPDNLEAYRELVTAGIMIPISTFTKGPESLFRFTEEGWNRREEWINGTAPRPGSP